MQGGLTGGGGGRGGEWLLLFLLALRCQGRQLLWPGAAMTLGSRVQQVKRVTVDLLFRRPVVPEALHGPTAGIGASWGARRGEQVDSGRREEEGRVVGAWW